MWTNAATLWCKIYSQENTSSCATGLCSIAILAVGETGRLAWCLKIIIGRRDALCRTSKMPVLPLTASAPQLTINNEYAVRAHGGGFISKPRHKERRTKSNSAVENSRNNRATRPARWLQGRCRPRQESGVLVTQRRH